MDEFKKTTSAWFRLLSITLGCVQLIVQFTPHMVSGKWVLGYVIYDTTTCAIGLFITVLLKKHREMLNYQQLDQPPPRQSVIMTWIDKHEKTLTKILFITLLMFGTAGIICASIDNIISVGIIAGIVVFNALFRLMC